MAGDILALFARILGFPRLLEKRNTEPRPYWIGA